MRFPMKTSSAGIALIQAFESCLRPNGDGRYRTYRCPANVVTIGWGTTAADVPSLAEGEVWSREKCDEVFISSLTKYEAIVDRVARDRVTPLRQHQFDALASLVYNCGAGALAGSVGKAVREGRDTDVPDLLARWNKAGGKVLAGLARRRKAEGELWSGDLDAAARTAQTVFPGSVARSRETPVPTTTDLARATPKATATIAAGATTAAAGGANHSGPDQIVATAVLVGFGLAIAIVAGVVLARKWNSLKENWA